KDYYGEHDNELHMPMDFMFTQVKTLSAPDFRKQIDAVEDAGGWPVYVISNHDIIRSYTRWGDGVHNDQIARVMAALYLTLRGSPIMYYGEEIGMENNDPKSKEDVKDPIGKLNWPLEKGRDGERTPMQWNDSPNAGFTKGTPWLPVSPNYQTRNVAAELKDPNSILNFYKTLLAMRHTESALLDGDYTPLNEDDPNVVSYLRRYKDEAILVVINMSTSAQTVSFDLSTQGFGQAKATTLLTTLSAEPPQGALRTLAMEPLSVYIARLSK
ncbi:MAG: alpha-glucosidase C-terminal domain-containing protein, partial [Candidatus Acidiferrales bacterium]